VPIPTKPQPTATTGLEARGHRSRATLLVSLLLLLTGCGEPSVRELKNRRELEALLTAISLKNQKELDKDIQRIEERHASGELSEGSYKDLREIIKKAQGGDWSGAEKQAYQMRESKPFFQ
jgi:hypothetical protein